MTLLIPPGYAQASLRLDLAGDPDPMYITFGIDIGDAGGDLASVVDAIYDAGEAVIPTILSSAYVSPGVQLAVGQDGGGALTGYFAFDELIEGADTGTSCPQNTSYLIQKRTGRLGRSGRGRMFVPGVVEGMVGPTGLITDAQREAVTNGWQTFLDSLALGTPSIPMVLLHAESLDLVPTLVTSLICDQKVATQRRRLR